MHGRLILFLNSHSISRFPFPRQLRLLKTGMASPRMAQIEVLRMVTGKESGVQCEVFQPPRFGIP